MNSSFKTFLFSICALFFPVYIFSQQSLPVTHYSNEDFYRRSQLIDSSMNDISFCMRPLYIADSLLKQKKGKLQFLPLTLGFQYNSQYPFERNDGAMIPAAGAQTLITTGIFYQSKHWSVQIKPELILAANPEYPGFPRMHDSLTWHTYYEWLNRSDIPEQFGTGSYTRLFPGQSSIRYNTKNFSFGISTENLWWGPGIYNSLLMSNNAPGFLHATFNTRKPIHSKIGSFEWQVIAGTLQSSGFPPPGTDITYNGVSNYQPQNQENRYTTGFTFSYQPKWVKGLFLGFSKMQYQYFSDVAGPIDILPLSGLFGDQVSASEKAGKKATLSSIFFRYAMPGDKAELYFEYGYGDRSIDPINLIFTGETPIPKAYTGGFRKLVKLKKPNNYIQLTGEITQMQLDKPSLIYGVDSWYIHDYVRQGYTNNGQFIGSSIGSGSNSQKLDVSFVHLKQKTGIGFERLVRNNDFYYNRYDAINDYRRHWVDLSTYLHTNGWQWHQLELSADLIYTYSVNYKWYILKDDIYNQYENGDDKSNFQFKLSLTYHW